ncbi:response regulator receiver domain-containing protein [Roseiarcus fermentans]|uniref:Response regulator receiver domain-containing protein n=1 Tax=Roseiarcus fermentans TaxID=1473586 RepID=A0A366FQP2_9HYPH|nr:response regulator [Roseiarcus fermentans]RBP16045.1 response regulator receiver domain-containing protein [Roseiarcus fermentans]
MARILIVDDEPLIAMLAEDWLNELGHETVGPALTLEDAVRLLDEAFDAAILDVSLGAGTSYPLAERLRERGVPFAFATGHVAADPGCGAVVQLAKPFDFHLFREVVGVLLGAPMSRTGASR